MTPVYGDTTSTWENNLKDDVYLWIFTVFRSYIFLLGYHIWDISSYAQMTSYALKVFQIVHVPTLLGQIERGTN